jgi:SAM-dependent methyltransferase
MTDESRAASMPEGLEPPPEADAETETRPAPTDSDPTGDSLAGDSSTESSTSPRRARMSLRIPDDEVVRPEVRPSDRPGQPGARASDRPGQFGPRISRPPEPPPNSENPPSSAPVVPARIISINPPPPVEVPPEPATEPAALAEQAEGEGEGEEVVIPDAPAVERPSGNLDPDGLEAGWSADDDRPTPVPVKGNKAEKPPLYVAKPPPVALAPPAPELDGEDVRFEEEVPTPALPPVMQALSLEPEPEIDEGRKSEPGDAPEVSPEDLVAVESVPATRISVKPVPPLKKAPPKPPLVIVPTHAGSLVPQPVDTPGSRRKGRLWWEDFFNDDYLRTVEKVTDPQITREVAFIEDSLGVERGGAILDLACGTGRHAVELATRGYEVVGFDLSLAMLARAGDEAQDRDVKLNFVQGDMREMSFDEQFDGIFCWNTSFGYFEEEKNTQVVARVHKALKTGGMFLLDVINRDFLVKQSPSLCWFEGDGCVCMDDMSVDFITSRMRVKRTMMFDDGRTREVEYSIRTYGLHELGKILHDGGFKVCEVSGRLATPGVYFGNESPRTIIVAEKR